MQSDELTDLEGIGGELAFCKLVGAYPDLTLKPRHGGLDTIWRGWRIDVKTTSVLTGHLLVSRQKAYGEVDRYVLMIGTFPTYRLAGYAESRELLIENNLRDFGYGLSYALSQDQLHAWPLDGLVALEVL